MANKDRHIVLEAWPNGRPKIHCKSQNQFYSVHDVSQFHTFQLH